MGYGMKDMTVVFLIGLILVSVLIAAMHFLRKRFPAALTESQQNTMIGPFSFIATLYAFLLGFVVVNLWQTFNEASRVTAREAETIIILNRLAEGLAAGRPFQNTLLEYGRSVMEDEWPAMAEGRTSKRTQDAYERLWVDGRALTPASAREQALYSRFVDELSELSRYRRDRLLLNERVLPGVLWGTLLTGGVLLLVGLFFLSVPSTRVQILVDVIVIGMMLLMLYLAVEFSGPFQGDVRVSPDPFEVLETVLRLP